MKRPSGTSRRIQECAQCFNNGDYEGALIHLFPAIDKTAKRRRPKAGVGERIRAFLEEEELLISLIATGSAILGNVFNGVSLPDALYKFGRTSLVHEGELDSRLRFNDEGRLEIGQDFWHLPKGYILGLMAAVITAAENSDEVTDKELFLNWMGESVDLADLWGNKAHLKAIICEKLQRPNLFKDLEVAVQELKESARKN